MGWRGTLGPRWGWRRASSCSELIPSAPLRAAQPHIPPCRSSYLIRDQGRPKSLQKIRVPELSQAKGDWETEANGHFSSS